MSFARETKMELARIVPEKKCCMLAEIAGFIRTGGSAVLLGGGKFRITARTEHPAVARHIRTLMREYYGISAAIEVGRGEHLRRGQYYLMTVEPDQMSEQILRETGILMIREGMDYITDGIYGGLIRTKCCRKAFLRGAFLAAGTMTDPENSYQFEIVCHTEILAADLRKLINSFVDIHAGMTRRRQDHLVYLKDSGQILDLLAIMGAHSQYFLYEDVRMRKELRNEANRRSNCDQANIDKSVAAAQRQVEQIQRIRQREGLESLPAKLREVAQLRLDHPEASLAELGELMDPPLKKSGVNGRMKKLAVIAGEEKR